MPTTDEKSQSFVQISSDEKAPTLIAVLPTLLQIIAVLSASFADQINLVNIFLDKNLILIDNILALILSLSLIGAVSYLQDNAQLFNDPFKPRFILFFWFEKYFCVPSPHDDGSGKNVVMGRGYRMPIYYKRFFVISLFILQVSFLIIFFYTVSLKIKNVFVTPKLIIAQSISYIAFMVISSTLLFIWFRGYTDKIKRFKPYQFIPNFENSLIRNGLLERRNVKIFSNNLEPQNYHSVVCELEGKKYKFTVSYDGNEIVNTEMLT